MLSLSCDNDNMVTSVTLVSYMTTTISYMKFSPAELGHLQYSQSQITEYI